MTRKKNKKPGSARQSEKGQVQADPVSSPITQKPQHPPKPILKTPSQPANMQPVYTWEDDPRPAKRQKTAADVAFNTSVTLEAGPQQDLHGVINGGAATSAPPSTNQLPSELRHLQNQYACTTMSIVSSSKIEQKVRNLLLRTKRPAEDDANAKPGVVILTAKAEVASKMVGIVEIAKRAIQQEGGQWWQYSKLHGQTVELKKKQQKVKRVEGGKTLREWADEQDGQRESVPEGKPEGKPEGQEHKLPASAELEGSEDEDEDEAAFQTMGRHQVMAYDENRAKLRAVPVMTIYLSRVPITALRDICR